MPKYSVKCEFEFKYEAENLGAAENRFYDEVYECLINDSGYDLIVEVINE